MLFWPLSRPSSLPQKWCNYQLRIASHPDQESSKRLLIFSSSILPLCPEGENGIDLTYQPKSSRSALFSATLLATFSLLQLLKKWRKKPILQEKKRTFSTGENHYKRNWLFHHVKLWIHSQSCTEKKYKTQTEPSRVDVRAHANMRRQSIQCSVISEFITTRKRRQRGEKMGCLHECMHEG